MSCDSIANTLHPVLYSYRRCPYAMRARLAIYYSKLQVEQREIVFWDKPEPMLDASPKGTVPVLVLADNQVIDESRDIMVWAFEQASDYDWLFKSNNDLNQQLNQWIDECDNEFKIHLDHYKYADRHPEQSQGVYRQQGVQFLNKVELALHDSLSVIKSQQAYLVGQRLSMADLAIFPFIRQFANVDKHWFAQQSYPALKQWLESLVDTEAFRAVFKNRPVWLPEHQPLWVDEPELQTKDQFSAKALADID